MNPDRIFNLFASVLTIAMITVILGSPNTAQILRTAGETFTGLLRTAMTGE